VRDQARRKGRPPRRAGHRDASGLGNLQTKTASVLEQSSGIARKTFALSHLGAGGPAEPRVLARSQDAKQRCPAA
jgi:hypothetical protein